MRTHRDVGILFCYLWPSALKLFTFLFLNFWVTSHRAQGVLVLCLGIAVGGTWETLRGDGDQI